MKRIPPRGSRARPDVEIDTRAVTDVGSPTLARMRALETVGPVPRCGWRTRGPAASGAPAVHAKASATSASAARRPDKRTDPDRGMMRPTVMDAEPPGRLTETIPPERPSGELFLSPGRPDA